jgi:hypothetical protein
VLEHPRGHLGVVGVGIELLPPGESSIGISATSTPSPQAARASAACDGSQTISTGSKAAIAFAISA